MAKLAYIAAALLVIPAPTLAQIVFDDSAPPPATAKAPTKAKGDSSKVVCRSQESIGSRLQAHQVCMTVDQWRTYEQAYKDQVAEVQARTQARSSNQ
jgi:hypothetical protein